MPLNAPCWCMSGISFKNCHHQRESQASLSPFEIEKEDFKRSKKGVCLHPSASALTCSSVSAINSHTIQKNGGLSAIADAGHVLTTLSSLSEMIKYEGAPPLQKKGINHASTFPGFCNRHDTELFLPVESGLVNLDKKSAFLLAFRAISLESYRKLTQLDFIKSQKLLDKGQPFWKQKALQQYLYIFEQGALLGQRDINMWKSKYDSAFVADNLSDFHHYTVRFKSVLPTVMCSALQVEYDFAGNILQQLGTNDLEYEHVCINIVPTEAGTVASLGFLGAPDGPASKFLSSFRDVPDHRKSNALVRAAFELAENIYANPQWWEDLPNAEREELRSRVKSGTPAKERAVRCLCNTGAHFLSAEIDQIVVD